VTALYAYAVVAASLDPAAAPSGIDDGPVVTVRAGDIAALVTPIDSAAYDPERVAGQSKDLAWLGARAAAHDRVITWAVDQGTVIPLPLFSLFRDADGVRQMLARRGAELSQTLRVLGDAREYTVRVYRLDAQLRTALAARSAEVAELESRVSSATPGQRYLLERKLEQTRREELDRVGRETGDEVFAALQSIARTTARDPVASQPAAAGHAVLNASFLVAARDVDAFRSTVTQLMERRGPEGFRLEFTGPWAPYHFVQTPADGLARGPNEPGVTPGEPAR
jgi:Gas vesicle synthesis protein GvpL/GvpF